MLRRCCSSFHGATAGFSHRLKKQRQDDEIHQRKQRKIMNNNATQAHVLSCVAFSSLVLSCLSCRVVSCLVLSCLVLACLVLAYLVLSCLILSCLVLSCLVLCEVKLSCLVLLVLSCRVLSCLVLSWLVLSYLVFSCLVLSCVKSNVTHTFLCRTCSIHRASQEDLYEDVINTKTHDPKTKGTKNNTKIDTNTTRQGHITHETKQS